MQVLCQFGIQIRILEVQMCIALGSDPFVIDFRNADVFFRKAKSSARMLVFTRPFLHAGFCPTILSVVGSRFD